MIRPAFLEGPTRSEGRTGQSEAGRSMVLGMFSQGKMEEGPNESSVVEGRVKDIGGT